MGQATTKIQDEQPNEIQQEIRDESIQDKQQNEDLPQTSNLELLSQIDFKQVLAQSRSFPPSSSSSSSSSSEDEAFIYPRNQPSMPPSPATTPPLVSSLQPPTLPSLLYKKNGRNSTNPTYEEWSAMDKKYDEMTVFFEKLIGNGPGKNQSQSKVKFGRQLRELWEVSTRYIA